MHHNINVQEKIPGREYVGLTPWKWPRYGSQCSFQRHSAQVCFHKVLYWISLSCGITALERGVEINELLGFLQAQ